MGGFGGFDECREIDELQIMQKCWKVRWNVGGFKGLEECVQEGPKGVQRESWRSPKNVGSFIDSK